MRIIIAIVLVALSYAAARACDSDYETEMARRAFPSLLAVSWSDLEPGPARIPSRPSFYGTPRDGQLPVFRRADGSLIPYSGPHVLADGSPEVRIDLHIDEGAVFVSEPKEGARAHTYYVDPWFVPRTRSTRLVREHGVWLHVDTDAVALRIERPDRAPQIVFETALVQLNASRITVTALYADGREERIFYYFVCGVGGDLAPVADTPRRSNAWWPHALLLAAYALCGITFARRLSGIVAAN
jgi:hypothetical protein